MSGQVTVEPTTDEFYIKSVFLNPTIYAMMRDDNSPADPLALMGVNIKAIPGFFLRVLVDGVASGVFWLIWKDDKLEAHTALLSGCRGARAIKAARAAQAWVWANTGAKAVTSYAWSDSPAVAWFCRAVGMVAVGTKPWPATRSGRSVDITYYNINREGGV